MKPAIMVSVFILAITSTMLMACKTPSPDYITVSPATLHPGDPIPPASGEVILTLSGAISASNADGELNLDMTTLEMIGLIEYDVYDPWLQAQVTYSGVLMSTLLQVIGGADSASKIQIIALDDYQVELTVADINKWPILLATRSNGNYMLIEEGGPTRIVFPYDDFPAIDKNAYRDLWIWNVRSMEVK